MTLEKSAAATWQHNQNDACSDSGSFLSNKQHVAVSSFGSCVADSVCMKIKN